MFVSRQLRSASLIAIGACLADYLGPLVNITVIGKVYGNKGLVVAGVVSPIMTCVMFICGLLLVSSVYLKSVANSSLDKEKADRFAGTGITLSVLAAAVVSLLLFLFSKQYLSLFNLADDTIILAQRYIRIFSLFPVLFVVRYYIYEEIFRMGKTRTAFAMDVMSYVSIIVLSIVGVKLMGIEGVALANVVMITLSIAVGVVDLIATHSELNVKITISRDCIKDMLKMGFMYAQTELYYLIYATIMYAFVGNKYGESCIAIFALLDSATEICSAFDGVPYAAANHYGVYLGENNTDGILKTIKAGLKLQSLVAVVISAIVVVFAGPIANFFGMEEAYYAQTIFALRIFALGFIFFAWLSFYQNYFACIGMVAPGVCISASQYIVAGIGVTIILGMLLGETGIYVGVFLECPIALIITRVMVAMRYHTKDRHLIDTLGLDTADIVSFDYDYTEDEIMKARNAVESELVARDIPHKTVMSILLSLEESCFMAYERNKKKVYGECTLMFKERHIDMIIRDSGENVDSTDQDQVVVSLRSYVLASMARQFKNQQYYLATNNNRVTFSFDY